MRTLSIDASDSEIKSVVAEWSELLAQKRYREALDLLPYSTEEYDWTPELLEQIIAGYGVIDPDPDTSKWLLEHHGVPRFEITTLAGRSDCDEIVNTKIDVDRENLYGLDPKHYVGMVHYFDVPLSGFRSDLTARFNIKRVDARTITLEFLDLHVM
jgi:hypothetical protein